MPSDTSFNLARFDHQASFPLVGVHAQTACATCHRGNVFRGTARDCVGCHRTSTTAPRRPPRGRGLPDHVRELPPADRPQLARRRVQPRRDLPAGRAARAGSVRHLSPQQRLSRHGARLRRVSSGRSTTAPRPPPMRPRASRRRARTATAPPTPAGAAPASITRRSSRWSVSTRQAACATCHRNNVYRGTARDCVGCHQELYNRTTAPAHAAAGFPTTCENCHRATDTSWRGAGFNHASVFPLVGQHAQAACATCHRNNVYRGTPRECVGCHQDLYNRTTAPAHAAAGFPTTCENCHRATDTQLARRGIQSRLGLRAGGPARAGGLHHLSSQQRLSRHPAHLRRLSPGQLQPHLVSAPRLVGLPDDVRELPPRHGQLVEPGHVQPPVPDHVRAASPELLDLSSVEHRRASRAWCATSTRSRGWTASIAGATAIATTPSPATAVIRTGGVDMRRHMTRSPIAAAGRRVRAGSNDIRTCAGAGACRACHGPGLHAGAGAQASPRRTCVVHGEHRATHLR